MLQSRNWQTEVARLARIGGFTHERVPQSGAPLAARLLPTRGLGRSRILAATIAVAATAQFVIASGHPWRSRAA